MASPVPHRASSSRSRARRPARPRHRAREREREGAPRVRMASAVTHRTRHGRTVAGASQAPRSRGRVARSNRLSRRHPPNSARSFVRAGASEGPPGRGAIDPPSASGVGAASHREGGVARACGVLVPRARARLGAGGGGRRLPRARRRRGDRRGRLRDRPHGPALHARHLDVGVVCLRSKQETGLAELFWTVPRRGEGAPLPPCATHRHLDRSWMAATPRDAAGAAAALVKWDGVDGDSFLGLSLAVGDRWGRPRRATTVTGEHIALVFLDTEVSRRGCGVM